MLDMWFPSLYRLHPINPQVFIEHVLCPQYCLHAMGAGDTEENSTDNSSVCVEFVSQSGVGAYSDQHKDCPSSSKRTSDHRSVLVLVFVTVENLRATASDGFVWLMAPLFLEL